MGLCKVITKANLVIYGALLLKNFLFPHNPPSTAERTNNSHDKECRWWHKISAHQPGQRAGRRAQTSAQEVQRCRGRAGAGTVHTSPAKQSTGLGSQSKWAQPHGTKGELRRLRQVHTSPTAKRVDLGGRRKPTQVAPMQRNPHKHLPSKFRPTAQGRTANDPRDR